ncbi:MAG: hypothetical protein C0402_10665 [Thermodesulfovibrio sp.]|nr:hypothetical protein [Thermodesulfovibrio sp.]
MEYQEQIKVLLVEDNPDDVAIIRRSFRHMNNIDIQVQWSPSLSSALENLATETFDIVVTDLGLPESRGIESFLKLHARYPRVPVIVLSGLSDETLAIQAVRSGAQDYLVKGAIDSASLLKAIRYSIERQRLLTELESKLEEIKKLERERKSVLSMFAHDIKNAIIPSTWVLKRFLSGKTRDLKDDLLLIDDSLKTAEELLTGFIEFSRFETKGYLPVKGDFDVKTAVLKQIEGIKLEAVQKDISVEYFFPAEPLPVILADERMIQRVIANLLQNAVKYNKPGGTVNVAVKVSETEILFEVRDTGIGIPDKHIPFIFDAFYRVSPDQKGSGLGLVIARTILDAHDGKIWVESEAGKGSTFSFTLPRSSLVPPEF